MSIITKITLTFSLLVFMISSLVGVLSYQANKHLLEEAEIAQLQHAVQTVEREFAIVFEALANDVLFLSDIPSIRYVAEYHSALPAPPTLLTEEQLIACSEGTFLGFMQNRDTYMQTRFIGRAKRGRELLRVERNFQDGQLNRVEASALKDQGSRSYFTETMRLADNGLYLSPIDLSSDHGNPVAFYQPTVRVATPVYTQEQEAVGMLIIDVALQKLFAKIQQHLPNKGLLYIANERGDYLLHPDSRKAFALESGKPVQMQQEFPFIQGLIDNQHNSVKKIRWQPHGDADSKAYFAYFSKFYLNPEKFPQRYVYIGFLRLHDMISDSRHKALLDSVRNAMVLCLIGIVVTFAFAVYLTRPLKQITNGVLRFSRGDKNVELSLPQQDEIGELARTCQKMADQIRWQLLSLQDEKNYLQTIFDTAVEGIVVINDTGIMESVNHAVIGLFGYSESELLGNNINMLMPHSFRTLHDQAIQHYLETGVAEVIGAGREVEGLRKDGQLLHLHIGVSELWVARKRKFVGMMHDISARKKAEHAMLEARDRAEAANRAKSHFLANMSHEFRTPLNGILGYTQLLRRDNQLLPKQHEQVNVIHRSGEHLLTLINDILDLSKIEAERLEIIPTELDFRDLVKDIGYLFKARAEQKGIAFICQETTPLPTGIYADGKRLRQVLINVLGNAIKFTQQGSVTFQVGAYKGTQCFDIIDTGIGIPAHAQENIFKPFHQVEQQNQHTEGTGLGLTITRKLVNMMGGHIALQSQEGKGSHFHLEFNFPILSSIPITTTFSKIKNRQIIGFRKTVAYQILVVDDKQDNRELLASSLIPLGFKIIEANHGKAALEQLEQQEIHFVLLDLFMPMLDGFATAQAIRNNPTWEHLPIIAVSAGVFAQQQQQALAAGCNGFLEKPVQIEELLEVLQKHLNIEWEYAELERNSTVERFSSDPALLREYLPQLQQHTRQGDIQGILDTLKALPKAQTETEFFFKIKTLAEDMDLQALRRLLAEQTQTLKPDSA